MTMDEDNLNSAFEIGREAYNNHRKWADNPYEKGSNEAKEWGAGFADAQDADDDYSYNSPRDGLESWE